MSVSSELLKMLSSADTKHDFHSSFKSEEIKKIVDANMPQVGKPTEQIMSDDQVGKTYLNEFTSLPNTESIKNDYIRKEVTFNSTGESGIQNVLINNGINANIFIISDTAYSSLKTDLKLFDTRQTAYWLQTKTTLYDAAGKSTPNTPKGKLLFVDNPNPQFKFCYEDISPGINENIIYPCWDERVNKMMYLLNEGIPEYMFFSNKNIFMISQGEVANYTTHKSLLLIKDPTKPGYFAYADETLANKNATNIGCYTKLAHDFRNLLGNLFNITNDKIINYDNSILTLAKRLGDSGQLLQCCKERLHLIDFNTNKKMISNGYHAFVSYDRIPLVQSLYAGVPIVIHDQGEKGFIYIHRKYINSEKNFYSILDANSFLQNMNEVFENMTIQKDNLSNQFNGIQTIFTSILQSVNQNIVSLNSAKNDKTFSGSIKNIFLYKPIVDIYVNIIKAYYDNNKEIEEFLLKKEIIIGKVNGIIKGSLKTEVEINKNIEYLYSIISEKNKYEKKFIEMNAYLLNFNIIPKNVSKELKEKYDKMKPFETLNSNARISSRIKSIFSNSAELEHIKLFGMYTFILPIYSSLITLDKNMSNKFIKAVHNVIDLVETGIKNPKYKDIIIAARSSIPKSNNSIREITIGGTKKGDRLNVDSIYDKICFLKGLISILALKDLFHKKINISFFDTFNKPKIQKRLEMEYTKLYEEFILNESSESKKSSKNSKSIESKKSSKNSKSIESKKSSKNIDSKIDFITFLDMDESIQYKEMNSFILNEINQHDDNTIELNIDISDFKIEIKYLTYILSTPSPAAILADSPAAILAHSPAASPSISLAAIPAASPAASPMPSIKKIKNKTTKKNNYLSRIDFLNLKNPNYYRKTMHKLSKSQRNKVLQIYRSQMNPSNNHTLKRKRSQSSSFEENQSNRKTRKRSFSISRSQ